MRLAPEITPKMLALFGSTLPRHVLRTLERTPLKAMVYADDAATPSCCVIHLGSSLYFGGDITPERFAYVKDRILTFEVYEKYGAFRFDLRALNRKGRAPDEKDVLQAVRRHLPQAESAARVPRGGSTYVYRVKTASETYYARFLPEAASFAAEATAHEIMHAISVRVPRIVAFEHREERSGLSMMLAEEIPGASMEEKWPEQSADVILREAGRQLALMHTIPVDGFGWIDRGSHDALKGEKRSFLEYFDDYLADDLICLRHYGFTDSEQSQIRNYMEQARRLLDVPQAVLVHGDFDTTHIFHAAGQFTGFIDFGEIRGSNRLFDLAVFAYNDRSPDRTAYYHLVDGYREAAWLTGGDLFTVELMALLILLRYAGKKVAQVEKKPQNDHWYRLIQKQLKRMEGTL